MRFIALAFALVSCASGSPSPAGMATPASVAVSMSTPPVAAENGPLLFRLKSRGSTLSVRGTSGHGPRFWVEDEHGGVVSSDLDEAALAAKHPELSEAYRTGTAAREGWLDATGPIGLGL